MGILPMDVETALYREAEKLEKKVPRGYLEDELLML